MNSTKKTAKSKATTKSNSARPKIPKGFLGAGRFTTREAIRDYYEPELKARAKREAAARKVAARKAKRDSRKTIMARPDGVTNRSELQGTLSGWGSTDAGQLREGHTYKWHGAYRVSGGAAALGKIASAAGSERVKMEKTADGNYELLITPGLGNFTPADAAEQLATIGREFGDQLAAHGAHVTYLGAFYNKGL